jgi:hypothetical protein
MKLRSIEPFQVKVTCWVLILGSGFDKVYVYNHIISTFGTVIR